MSCLHWEISVCMNQSKYDLLPVGPILPNPVMRVADLGLD